MTANGIELGESGRLELGSYQLTRIGLGTNRLMRSAEAVAFVRSAVGAGIQMIDTAHRYTDGESEFAIGDATSSIRTRVFVATKGGGREPGRGRREAIEAEIGESLRSLRTDCIPLYYLHHIDPETPLEESLAAISDAKDRGQIEHIGICNVTIEQIERARTVAPIAVVQNHFSLVERKHENLVDYCAREGIVFVPYFPLRGDDPAIVHEIARQHQVTPHQIRLAWLLKRSPSILPIPGTLSIEHLNQNLAALQVQLSDAEFAELAA